MLSESPLIVEPNMVVYIELEQDEWLTAQECAAGKGTGRRRGRWFQSQITGVPISAAMASN